MLKTINLVEFPNQVKNNITEIKRVETVIDDTQLVSFLKEHKESDNIFLIGVVPQYGIGGNEDVMKWNNQLTFFLLSKYSDRDLKHSQKIELIGQVQETAQEFVNLMLSEHVGDNGDICGLTNDLS